MPQTSTPSRTWYGWQTLAGAAGASLLVAAAFEANSSALLDVGLGGFVLSGPITHAAHANWGKAAGSLALNLGLPGLGFLGGAAVGVAMLPDDCTDLCGMGAIGPALIGTAIGGVTAVTLDSALLAWEDNSHGAPRKTHPGSQNWSPTVATRKGGMLLGIAGVF